MFCRRIPLPPRHLLSRPAHPIAAPPNIILAGAFHHLHRPILSLPVHHCRTAILSWSAHLCRAAILSWLVHHRRAAISIPAGASSLRHHSILASASLLRRDFYLGWRIIAVPQFLSRPAHHCCATILSWPVHHCRATISILAGASLLRRHILSQPAHHCLVQQSDCKPIFSSAAPSCAVPASTKESSSCPLMTILLQANLLFSHAIVRCSANNPLTPLQRLTLRLPPPSQLDCCRLPAPASLLQDTYAHRHHVERRGVVQGILNQWGRETIALCIIAPCQ